MDWYCFVALAPVAHFRVVSLAVVVAQVAEVEKVRV